jgi:pectate lyase
MNIARVLLSGAAIFALGATAAHALPVVPGEAGYGMSTPAGRGGKVYKVTNLNASGTGSLKACTDATGARVCVFQVSGYIRLTDDLLIRNGPITIAGQTAPSPGITIRGAGLKIHGSNILVQHIRVRPGDDLAGPDPENRDALKLEGSTSVAVTNVVIDHCTFSWALDEVASIWGPHDNITFSNNIFSEPLNDSYHPTKDGSGHLEPHGFAVIIDSASSGGRVTMTNNLIAHSVERNPLSRARELVYVNNLVYNAGERDLDLQSQQSRTTKTSIEGNVFLQGPSTSSAPRPLYVRTSGTYKLYSGSKVYAHGTYAPDWGTSLSSVLVMTNGDLSTPLLTSSKPVWNDGITVRSASDNSVYNHLMAYAGARPKDRDNTDKRVIDSVKTRSGQIINCVSADGSTRCQKNAHGWPTLAQNHRTLTLPSNPNSVASNGYTNLENWLHSLGDTLEGVTSSTSPAAPAAVSVK